jgi:PAS domain S-box-containing protein
MAQLLPRHLEAEELARAFHALHALAEAAARGLDPRSLAQLAVEEARGLLGVDAASLRWWDAEAGALRALAHTDRQRATPPVLIRAGEGAAGQAFQRRAPVTVEDYPRWEHAHPEAPRTRLYTAAAVPLLAGARALGALGVRTYGPHHYTPGEVELLAVLAAQVGPVLEAARLYEAARELAAARKQAEERVRELVEGLDAIVWEADGATFQFTFVSQRAAGILGYPVERWLTEPDFWISLVHPEDRAHALATCQTAVAAGQDHDFEYRAVAADGRVVWLHDIVRVASDAAGHCQLRGVMVDVTARKLAEQQQQALAQSEKLRALGQMAGGVAHNLNQSLAIIAGYSDLARQVLAQPQPDVASLRDTLEMVAQAAMDGGEMVKRLLHYARSQQGGPREVVALDGVLDEVAKLTAPRWRDAAQADGRPIDVSVTCEGDVRIEATPDSLREALASLVFNAIDALPYGGRITLAARRRGHEVEVVVADSGVGMAPDVQGHAFEPFYTTKGERGSGLGLAMVLGIVEQHQGRVAIRSVPNEGTTVVLRFPAAPVGPGPDGPTADAVTPAEAAATASGRLRVLAVDDEPALCRMVATMLSQEGHTVATATSGEEALERLAAEPFDLVVSDVSMGTGMNGWELAAAVHERWPQVRLMLATGWGATIDPAAARAQGIEAVIAKPYRMAALRRLIAGE